MNVLVIGAGSLVGSCLVLSLKSSHHIIQTYHQRPIDGAYPLNVEDKTAVKELILNLKPQVIVLSVMERGGADFLEDHAQRAESLHFLATSYVVQAATKIQAKVVFCSSDYIFDGKSGPYTEEDTPNPLSIYGREKLKSENLIQAQLKDYLILRTTAVFDWDKKSINLAMQIWENLSKNRSIKLPSDQICTPTLARDFAKITQALLDKNLTGIFNVAGKDLISRYEFGKMLAQIMGLKTELVLPVTTSAINQKAPRPLNGGLKTNKIEQTLGFSALTLEQSLKLFKQKFDKNL